MKKLFLSYSALMKSVANGSVTDTDLAQGLYYFGCSREQVFAPWTDDAPKRIMTAVEKAETEGRVAWKPRYSENSYRQLSELLIINGFAPIATHDVYNYGIVADRVRQAGLDLQVVSR